MNSFCSFFYALCYKAVLLRRQMIEDDLLGSYTVHSGYSTFSIPRDFFNGNNDVQIYGTIYQLRTEKIGNP